VTQVSMIPELNLGVLVFTNQQSGAAMTAVTNQIVDAYVRAPKHDWVAIAKAADDAETAEYRKIEAEAGKVAAAAGQPAQPLDIYAGRYRDAWRGDAVVRREGDKLVLKFSRTDKMEGPLSPYNGDVFIVRWNDRSLQADAYVRFSPAFGGGIEGMTMRPVSPATDFSADFQDLDFKKVAAQ